MTLKELMKNFINHALFFKSEDRVIKVIGALTWILWITCLAWTKWSGRQTRIVGDGIRWKPDANRIGKYLSLLTASGMSA